MSLLCSGDAGLRQHFENTVSSVGGSLRSVKVAMRKGPDGKALSMGFGFVECSSEDVAKAVLKRQQVSQPPLMQASLQEWTFWCDTTSCASNTAAPAQKPRREHTLHDSIPSLSGRMHMIHHPALYWSAHIAASAAMQTVACAEPSQQMWPCHGLVHPAAQCWC